MGNRKMRYRSDTNIGFRLRHLTFKGGRVLMLKLVTYQEDELPRSRSTPKWAFLSTHGLRKEVKETGNRPIATAQAPHQYSCRFSGALAIIG